MQLRTMLLVAVQLVAAGCSCQSNTNSDGGLDLDGSIPVASLPDVFLTDVCASLIQCYHWDYCSASECKGDQAVLGLAAFEAELDAGWLRYDPAAAYACHVKFAADPCHFGFFSFTVPTVAEVLVACPGAVTGQRSAGQSCASVADCTPDSFCDNQQCPSTCLKWLGKGAACSVSSGALCNFHLGLNCNGGTCRGGGAVGSPCAGPQDCSNAECKADAGVCVGPAALGRPCTWLGDSEEPACGPGLWCDNPFTTGTCVALSATSGQCFEDRDCETGLACLPSGDAGFGFGRCGAPSGVGGPCGQGAKDCGSGLLCAPSDAGNLCKPLLGPGQLCSSFRSDCQPSLSCASFDGGADVCISRRCLGESCDDGVDVCGQTLCQSNHCVAHAALGAACTNANTCASSSCKAGVCTDPTCSP